MSIDEWIGKLESDRSLTIEQFYGRLKAAKLKIEERLELAEDDGVDLDELPDEE